MHKDNPVNYTLVADNFVLAPQPTGATTVNMTYYKIPQPMSDTNPTNEYLDVCPDLVLYASLAESAPFLMDDPRLATWDGLYQTGLASHYQIRRIKHIPSSTISSTTYIGHNMDFSNYLANKLISATVRNTSYPAPRNVYLALFKTDPTKEHIGIEVTGDLTQDLKLHLRASRWRFTKLSTNNLCSRYN